MDKSTKNSKSQKKSKKSSKSSKSSSDSHNQRLVEYSDVSSNELSAPEAGELPSDGLSIVSDDEISTVGTNNNNSIYEPIDDDDEELEKLMEGDGFSDFSESNKRKKKQKKKQKKVKKSKKRKKRRRSSEESIEEISDDEALLDSVDDGKHSKRLDEGGTPPLDQISYTPKNKFDGYTPISPGNY